MAQGQTGVTSSTQDRFLLDAGLIYANIDLTALKDASASDPWSDAIGASTAIALGALRDNAEFNANRTMRDIEANGLLGPTKGLVRRERVEPTLSGTFIELTSDNMSVFLAGADTTTAGSFTSITGGPIESGDYYDTVAMATTYSGSTNPVVIVLKNVLVAESPSVTTADRNEGSIGIVFRAHFDPSTPQDESSAYEILHPGNA